jgi:PAS domain S-box-containing protein
VLRTKVSLYSAFQQKNALLREREQRIRGMEELLRAERNLSAVLETHPIGILVADSDGEVIQINGEVGKVWGHEKTRGKGVHGWWDHDDKLLEAVNGLMARVLRTGETSRNEFTRYTREDGTTKTVLTTASALRNLDGTVVGVVVVMQDLTEHTHIEQDIVQRMYQLAAMHPELKQAIRH